MGTKFQTLAIQYQMDSDTKAEAKGAFRRTCNICVSRGINADCDACPIKVYHEQTLAVLDDLRQYDEMKQKGKVLS